MKLGLTIAITAVLAAALLGPAAAAKPGNGHGHGPPAWAGGGGGATAKGKPAWAGKGQAKKAEKAAQKEQRRAAREAADDETADAPKHDNPAWVCKFERERMGAEAFAELYGTNDSKANAFGKCVSREAHDRDGVTPDDEEQTPPDEPTVGDGASDDAGAEVIAGLEEFFLALRQLVF